MDWVMTIPNYAGAAGSRVVSRRATGDRDRPGLDNHRDDPDTFTNATAPGWLLGTGSD
jgi:hypothetical protein